MVIELESITRDVKVVALTVAAEAIELEIDGATLKRDIEFEGSTERIAEKAHLRGRISTETEVECTRCLEPVTKSLEIEFDDIFVDPADEPVADEMAVAGADLDESIAIDGKIDVAEVIREQIILALPEQTFCRADCKGLCPKCGENLNLIDCNCTESEIDPRWAALKNLN